MAYAMQIPGNSHLWYDDDSFCPYCDRESEICGASCSSMSVGMEMRLKYCLREDFDDCPVFLAKRLSGR
ncbi:MAG: hypothetical protein WC291_08425 [Thermodesulfovibrionales bacterium]